MMGSESSIRARAESASPFHARPPFDGSRDHRDIRTFYTSELAYLKAIRQRYSCQFCGTATGTCGSCAATDERIAELEKQAGEEDVAREAALFSEDVWRYGV